MSSFIVLMDSVGEGNARALSVGWHRNGGDDLFRVDHDELIVLLRELHECHVRPCLLGTRADRSTDHAREHRRCYRMDGGMSALGGTKRPSWHVRLAVAIGRKADMGWFAHFGSE
jgi:hypothetical protein